MKAISSTFSRLKRRALPRTVGSKCVASGKRAIQFSTSRGVAPEAARRPFMVVEAFSVIEGIWHGARAPSMGDPGALLRELVGSGVEHSQLSPDFPDGRDSS